ncbi:M20/M25/M40 family metallo-hydrolase [Arthrobacter sp. D3-16]
MKLVLFDLGDTLERDGVLLPGALETLDAIASLRTEGQPAVVLGLLSDFHMPARPSDVAIIQQQYYALLEGLGIRQFFEPVAERVTLSTEVGVFKPDEAVFRAAAAKVDPALDFGQVLFVTENRGHVVAARQLGLMAVHVRGPGQAQGEVETLAGLVPLVQAFIESGDAVETVVLELPSDSQDAVISRIAAGAARWTRLGDVLVVRSPVSQASHLLARGGLADTAHRLYVPERPLSLVIQTARLFQEDHPSVRVVVDKGRYLVVELGPDDRSAVAGPHASSYMVRALPPDTVVFDQRGPRAKRTTPVEAAAGPARRVSRVEFEDDVGRLARLRTRHSGSAEFLAALQWAEVRLADLGYATHLQTVPVRGGTTRNLIADSPGNGEDRDLVLVTAHLDSVNIQGAAAAAPGADDNASGSAGVLAIGRALAGQPARHDLRLILFGGEEQGLFGSRQYVNTLDVDERSRISAVVNMDMIACQNTSQATVLLEGGPVSHTVIEALAEVARAHTSLAVQTSLTPFNSDHVPFIDLGIPAVLTIEGTDSANDRVHTDRDTLDTLDLDLAMEILRMNVVFVAQSLGRDTRIAGPIT